MRSCEKAGNFLPSVNDSTIRPFFDSPTILCKPGFPEIDKILLKSIVIKFRQKYDLEVYNPVGSNGVFLPDTELFAGQSVFKANPNVIELLIEKGALLKHIDIQHSYPHCWRHKSPIIFRATPQWFVSMDQNGLRDAAMQAITETQWMPEWGQKRIEGMVEGRPDWCVSRQRTWGVPIPLFVHQQTGELHPNTQPSRLELAVC